MFEDDLILRMVDLAKGAGAGFEMPTHVGVVAWCAASDKARLLFCGEMRVVDTLAV